MNVDEIVGHLTAGLAADALPSLATPPSGTEPHAFLHERIGAAGRALRTSRREVPLHAGACTNGGIALLVAGNTGSGKSTLTALWCRERSARFISDDTVWVQHGRALGFGAPLSVRRSSPFFAEASALPYATGVDRLLVAPADLGIEWHAGDAVVGRVVFPSFRAGPPSFEWLSAAASFCRLLAASLRPTTDHDIDELAHLASRLPAAAIAYGDSATALDLVDRLVASAAPDECAYVRIGAEELELTGFGADVDGVRFGDEVAVWHRATGEVVHLESWSVNDQLEGTPAFEQLRAMGFVTPSGLRR